MNYLIADQALLERLGGIVEPVEIRAPEGKVLGHYTPVLSPEEEEAYTRAAELFDLEELDEIEQNDQKGYTIEEIHEYLRSLEAPK
jgi:hypothetical protein